MYGIWELDHSLSTRNMPFHVSLLHSLLSCSTDPETSSDLVLCQDTFYSKWICLFVLLLIPYFCIRYRFIVACHVDNASFVTVGSNIEMNIAQYTCKPTPGTLPC